MMPSYWQTSKASYCMGRFVTLEGWASLSEARDGGTFSSSCSVSVEPPCDCLIHCRNLCSIFATVWHKLSPGHPNLSAPVYLWDCTVVTISLHLLDAEINSIFFNGFYNVSRFWESKLCFNYYFGIFFFPYLWVGFFFAVFWFSYSHL